MFIRTLDELEKLGRIRAPLANNAFRSARFLTAADGMGYSYNENRVKKGTDAIIWLKHHWEANYIISGKGGVTELASEDWWLLEAGVLYVVGPNDRHRLLIEEDAHYISIFCPPLRATSASTRTAATKPAVPSRRPIGACSSNAPATCAAPARR
jgi:L-ectoine synthase